MVYANVTKAISYNYNFTVILLFACLANTNMLVKAQENKAEGAQSAVSIKESPVKPGEKKQQEPVKKPLVLPVPPEVDVSKEDWLVNRRGIEALDDNFVLPPFDPVKADAKGKIEVWGRKYSLDDYGFLSQSEIRGMSFFDKPMSFEIEINGKKTEFKPESRTLLKNPKGRAEYLAKATSEDADIETRTSVEYDGMIRIDFKIIPKGSIELNSFKYRINYPGKHALFMHYIGAKDKAGGSLNLPRNSYSRDLPKGEGVIWKSPFKTLVWMGDYEKGFLWFCHSEQYWSPIEPDQRPAALKIVRQQDEVVLEISPVSQPVRVSMPVTYTFGMFATPVRPETKGWRGWTHSANEKQKDVFIKIKYGVSGKYSMPVGFYPRIQNLSSYKEYIEKIHTEGRYGTLYLDPRLMTMGILETPETLVPPDWNPANDHAETNVVKKAGIFKWQPPEIKYYQEWRIEPPGYTPYNKEKGEKQFLVSMKSSYSDFFCYLVEQHAKAGADGISDLDEWGPMADINPRHDAGYVAGDGKRYPDYDWFAKRDLIKRICAIFLKERGKPPIMIVHGAATLPIPIISFCDGTLTGEDLNVGYLCRKTFFDEYSKGADVILECIKNGGKDWYYYAAPLDRWVVLCGKQFGFAALVMSNLWKNESFNKEIRTSEKATRDFLAMVVLHDNLVWPIFCNPNPAHELQKIRQDFGIADEKVEFFPYWGKKHPAQTKAKNIFISSYKNGNKYLVNVSNLGLEGQKCKIRLNPEFFMGRKFTQIFLSSKIAQVTDAATLEKITVDENYFTTEIEGRDYKIFLASGLE
ncbi:MAG: DUF6067 family protein [Kiritimatiellae bacterium]|nr:DUF6067 family protein [Kiritimatiellia bacterium]MDD5522609.1 DUF6067 family protein [Kiritimatiellia bacterium]